MSDVTMKEKHGTAYYTTRDLLLYAVGIGCTSTEPSEMKYLYERDVQFRAFATFPLALPFRATMTSNHNGDGDGDGDGDDNWNKTDSTRNASRLFGMPVFPPPMMDPFPTNHSVNTNTNTNTPSTRRSPGPVIHLSQKFRLHRSLPLSATIPVEVDITTHIVSIVPHKRGSIIITETRYVCTTHTPSTSTATSSTDGVSVSVRSSKGGLCPATAMGSDLLATSQSAVLYPQKLEPISASTSRPTSTQKSNKNSNFSSTLKPIKFDSNCSKGQLKSPYTYAVKRYTIGKDQALLYRLSGDTNGIHVEGSPALFHTARPILHGLCTLGYAVRAVLCSISDGESEIGSESASASGVPICQYVECRFKKPVFVGDELEVRIWNGNDSGNGNGNGAQSLSSNNNHNEHTGGESASVSVESAYFFEIRNVKSNTIVVDRGIVGVGMGVGGHDEHALNSKL